VNTYSQGLLTAVNHAGSSWATLTYHPNLLVNVVTHGNGMTETIANDPNDLQRPLSITVQSPEGRWPPGTGTNNYLYDGGGNILRIGSAATGDLFQYDRLSRLVKGKLQTIAPVPEQTYGFDAFGNILSITTQIGTGTPTVEGFNTSASTNHLHNPSQPSLVQYDDGGNLVYRNFNRYFFDLFNSMTRMCSNWTAPPPGGSCIGEDWYYVYTADDERLVATKGDGTRSFWTVRDLGGRLLTRDERGPLGGLFQKGNPPASMKISDYLLLIFADGFESGNTSAWSSTSSGTTRSIRDYIWRGDKLLGYRDLQGFGRHFGLDHLGTVRVNADDVTADFLCRYDYYPFGRQAWTDCTDAEPMKYTGHERDLQSTPSAAADDLDYLHARFSSPVTARFLSTDPVLVLQRTMSNPQGWNRYSYTRGNPLKRVDRDGKLDFLFTVGGNAPENCDAACIDAVKKAYAAQEALRQSLTPAVKAFYQKAFGVDLNNLLKPGVGPTVQLAKGDSSLSGLVGDSNKGRGPLKLNLDLDLFGGKSELFQAGVLHEAAHFARQHRTFGLSLKNAFGVPVDESTLAIREAALGGLPSLTAFIARGDKIEGHAAEILQFGDILTLSLTAGEE
jgi:RHS repeat-associated protein